MASTFPAHGHFTFCVEGQLLVSEVTGPWNLELVQEWARAGYGHAVKLAANGPFVAVGCVLESMLCPPDALQEFRRTVQFSTKHLGCLANVTVAGPDVEGRALLDTVFGQVYQGVGLHRVFFELEPAKAWALELLALRAQDPQAYAALVKREVAP